MARAAVKAKQQAQATQKAKAQPAKARQHGRRKHASGGNPNQQLFFVRMRRRAKPMYYLLAALFALTFIFLGVGTGTNGGLDQLFNNLNIFHHGGTSVSSALKETEKNPKDPKGFRDLATAYEAKNETPGAIGALQQYTALRPKAVAEWSELGGLEMTNAQTLLTQYQDAYTAEGLAAPSQVLAPSSSSPLEKALGANPIEQVASTGINSEVSTIGQGIEEAYSGAVSAYQTAAKLQPDNANAWFQLAQAAQTANDNRVAVGAYEKFLKLNPDSSSASQVRQLIKQLSG
ncbi:MAG: hypothetical protein JOY72_05255 [Actinobacteria bacterium]|nr:hypothetical protein [Actinomycetota bacterium]MBV8479695.1 hypothetical protein [Actinomycetota bacterium]